MKQRRLISFDYALKRLLRSKANFEILEGFLLMRQLQRRFGPVPAWVGERVAQADVAALEEWGLRILDARTLEAVCADRS